MRVALIFLLCLLCAPVAAQSLPTIRDAEIEAALDRWSAPLVQAAGMRPGAVRLIIVNGDDVNAFVAGGANIFLYTGLLLEAHGPEEVAGVIAHELGHIAGGHLIVGREEAKSAMYKAMLAQALGLAAAAAGGRADAAVAAGAIGQQMAGRGFLAHSRTQESGADQAALTFMARAGQDPTGLYTFLDHLDGLHPARDTPGAAYTTTHPLTPARLAALEDRTKASPHAGRGMDPAEVEVFARVQAKLLGFLHPQRVMSAPARDPSFAQSYARAIALWRTGHISDALSWTDDLLAQEPRNPYILELKGQILLESGNPAQAVPLYARAVRVAPKASLIRLAYGHALLESGDAKAAISPLARAAREEPETPLVQRLLATAYGRTGDKARADLHLAEEAALLGRKSEAIRLAQAALRVLPPGSAGATRAQDLLATLGDEAER
ncbi:MAG TPA: peptidase M48 family protein [Rhodospirillaceae bacterium]|jgi:predicted Zn-dependent protease|nr:M48 family metalloprotease [Alphaproteobacteria bacterium]HBH26925.1 peptidase M48 family protein [Rhodospirillaceae bacterium]